MSVNSPAPRPYESHEPTLSALPIELPPGRSRADGTRTRNLSLFKGVYAQAVGYGRGRRDIKDLRQLDKSVPAVRTPARVAQAVLLLANPGQGEDLNLARRASAAGTVFVRSMPLGAGGRTAGTDRWEP